MSKVRIEELNLSDETIEKINRIQAEVFITKRKDKLRALLGGPMCSICSGIPTKRIYYKLDGLTRIEAYCDKHFEFFEKTRDTSMNDIIEGYGCIKANSNV